MASGLKLLKSHIKSVGNIQKVTGSMKLVAAARFIQAEKIIKVARPMGHGARKFYEIADIPVKFQERHHLLIPFTSDRGLCGGCHLRVCKKCKHDLKENPGDFSLYCVGEKSRSILGFDFPKLISLVVNGVGHKPPTFRSASELTKRIINSNFYHGTMYFPMFKNMLSFHVVTLDIYSNQVVANTEIIFRYDVEDVDLESYIEFSIAAQVFYVMCDTYLVELSSRINAMSSATKNAGKLKKTLSLQYNRVRQALITKELVDIIGGASVVTKKK